MKKLKLLSPALLITLSLVTSCAREEQQSCSEPQIEPGTEQMIDSDGKQDAKHCKEKPGSTNSL